MTASEWIHAIVIVAFLAIWAIAGRILVRKHH
jgi:hypothetical protein